MPPTAPLSTLVAQQKSPRRPTPPSAGRRRSQGGAQGILGVGQLASVNRTSGGPSHLGRQYRQDPGYPTLAGGLLPSRACTRLLYTRPERPRSRPPPVPSHGEDAGYRVPVRRRRVDQFHIRPARRPLGCGGGGPPGANQERAGGKLIRISGNEGMPSFPADLGAEARNNVSYVRTARGAAAAERANDITSRAS